MNVKVRLFAALREASGHAQTELSLPAGATAEDAWRQLTERHPALAPHRPRLAAAVNRSYASFAAPLRDGDELVFVPPVSGG